LPRSDATIGSLITFAQAGQTKDFISYPKVAVTLTLRVSGERRRREAPT
jgi:hypothetical protein